MALDQSLAAKVEVAPLFGPNHLAVGQIVDRAANALILGGPLWVPLTV